jgi:uncharacterized protein (DUF4415 family)
MRKPMRPPLHPEMRPPMRPEMRPPMRPLTDEDGEVRELTHEDFEGMRPIAEVDPDMLEAVAQWRKVGRPKTASPKVHISFRLAAEVVESIKATGEGYNARVEQALRDAFIAKAAGLHPPSAIGVGNAVYIMPRLKGRHEGAAIEGYVIEDHEDHLLKTFKTQKEAIDWAKKEGHHPLVARVLRSALAKLEPATAPKPTSPPKAPPPAKADKRR